MMTQSSGRQALAALRVGWIRTFSAAGSDEPYFVVSRGDSDSGKATAIWTTTLVNFSFTTNCDRILACVFLSYEL